ncbi:MAG: imidazolonepropionase [Phycisphaerales bacterium]|nr:imidazolonepropionase [Phycisphaerales bacterium]
MSSTTIVNARVLTLAAIDGSTGPRRGQDLRELRAIDRGSVRIEGTRIAEVAIGDGAVRAGDAVIDAEGRVVMPCFVDCHTHACWAGSRHDEFEMRLAGLGYLEILQSGGGIMSTVRAVRAASREDLVGRTVPRLRRMAAMGTGTVEVKSGYGLTTDDELKMLHAIRDADAQVPMTIVPTFLGAHAIDPAQPDFVERTINETLPLVVQAFPGIACDAYCEEGAWSLADARRLFENALDIGCAVRVHADQFHSLGMTRLAVEMGAASVDHLEAVTPSDLQHLAHSDTIGVVLPCSGFTLDDRYAPARELVDAGGALAIATNFNPGSAPCPSMPFAIALAARKLLLSPAEAIVCATWNAACVLGLQFDVGSLEPGKRADVQMLDTTDERDLAFEVGGAGPRLVIVGGEVVRSDPGLSID